MKRKMKVALFSRWPFGLRGTPGTYLFVEKLRKYCHVLIIAPVSGKDIVFVADKAPIIPIDFSVTRSVKDAIFVAKQFNPDIFYIFNFPDWYDILVRMKARLPDAKFILDIKTPLLKTGPKRKEIQDRGMEAHGLLDAVVTLAKESVDTWLPEYPLSPVVYPLGVDIGLFNPTFSLSKDKKCSRFVFIGTLHPKREVDVLIDAFSEFIQRSSDDVFLDIYGRGPDFERLEAMTRSYGVEKYIRMIGLVEHDELLAMLPDYDVGIVWVPYQYYNASPSLKSLEYMGSGLTVMASDTEAHKKLIDEGFKIHFFSNDKESLVDTLSFLSRKGEDTEVLNRNYDNLRTYDYDYIIRKYHLVVFRQLLRYRFKETGDVGVNFEQNSHLKSASENDDNPTTSHSVCNGKRLKLIIFCESFGMGKGGAERVASELASEMSLRGHLIYLAYKMVGSPAYLVNENVVLLPFSSPMRFKRVICEIDPDVFFVFYFNRKLIEYYSLISDTQIPFGMQECTNPDRLRFTNWPREGIPVVQGVWEREVIAAAAARIRMVMPGYENSFPEYIRSNVRSFTNPCFPQEHQAEPASSLNGRKSIININGFKMNKNLITLLKAFKRLAPSFPEWDLKIFGKTCKGTAPHKIELIDFINNSGLSHRIFICGPAKDIFEEYAAANVHVIASRSEGCPTCVLEAMSTGLPSIGYEDCPGTNKLIIHGKNGLLAASSDPVEGLESALRRYMLSTEFAERLGKEVLKDSRTYIPKTIYDNWETLFFEAAAYKNNMQLLAEEQMDIDKPRALHAQRMRSRLVREWGG
jgi:glycosyltransferase involved in cell wall biosynthesis